MPGVRNVLQQRDLFQHVKLGWRDIVTPEFGVISRSPEKY